ncbi:MAG: transcriptional repressor [Actinomycetota bacterium]|nr:MAG: Fur family transcriptional regulator ferric uptake [Actinomycetota bacterium]MDO8950511.1 transcriptional repressor [Actinomycetota bacterium]MDP3631501.1 transcriptional repressor [Actinomycetota bacterium]
MATSHTQSTAGVRDLYGGRRVSAARRTIADAAALIRGAFTVEQLHDAVQLSEPGIGIATVYRAVAAMSATGSVAPVGYRAGSALYALCPGGTHHHHLVCTGCGSVVGIACPVDRSLEDAARKTGYTVTGHEVTLYGLCRSCAGECD